MDCTTADAAPAAADFVRVEQRFEGQNLQYIKIWNCKCRASYIIFLA
jgi:hypothetical protein